MVVGAFASGIVIYAKYVDRVRVQLFLIDPRAGFLFETKEHLAFAVSAITLGAGVTAWFAPRDDRQLRRAAALAFGVAAFLCVVTSGLGTYIAGVHGFGATR